MKKKTWIIISVVVLCLIVVVLIAVNTRYYISTKLCENEIFGHTYGEYGTIYYALSTGHPNFETPVYEIAKDGTLIYLPNGKTAFNRLSPIRITKENFDDYFDLEWHRQGSDHRAVFREQIKAAWSCNIEGYTIYIILKNDGAVYICNLLETTDQYGFPSYAMRQIVWLNKLTEDE